MAKYKMDWHGLLIGTINTASIKGYFAGINVTVIYS